MIPLSYVVMEMSCIVLELGHEHLILFVFVLGQVARGRLLLHFSPHFIILWGV